MLLFHGVVWHSQIHGQSACKQEEEEEEEKREDRMEQQEEDSSYELLPYLKNY